MVRKVSLLLSLILSFYQGFAQDSSDVERPSPLVIGKKYPKDYFQAPLDIPMYLSGNFAELRPNHFHAGIDIKTQGVEGKKVFAVAEGYISRIKIQHGGYGKVLYLTHPNGFTSVYGHLKKFSPSIESYIKREQYKKQSYTIEVFPSKNKIKVDKGEVIGLSGNTGGSFAPHLHFEIRETDSEIPVNPLLFGMNVKDNIRPIIKGIRIYPLTPGSHRNKSASAAYIPCSGQLGKYHLNGKKFNLHGDIAIGLATIDRINGSKNRNGVFSIQLLLDGKEVYYHQMEKVPFHESLFINSHADYRYKKITGRWVHKCFIDPNNNLSIYGDISKNGIMKFTDDKLHKLSFVVRDVYNNVSRLDFEVQSEPDPIEYSPPHDAFLLKYDEAHQIEAAGMSVHLPEKCLYRDTYFKFNYKAAKDSTSFPTYQVHSEKLPLHRKATLEVDLSAVPDSLLPYVVLRRKDSKGRTAFLTGKKEDNVLKIRTRTLGSFNLAFDTIAPTIKPYNFYDGKPLKPNQRISVSIRDRVTGIRSYRTELDGKWLLMEYDYKKNRLTHYPDGTVKPGEHELKVIIEDMVGNKTERILKLIIPK